MSPHPISRGNARRFGLRHGAALLPLLSFLVLGGGAQAQTVDYGALEQLFGESVTTSATGQPQRATEVPAAMEIVTADKIRRSGAIDIPGVLKQTPGVDVMQWGTDNADVSVRGYNQAFSPRLLVLVDGRQVYADHYGYTPWSTVPVELSAIRQIEVVKGPNTALFGFNAVSGVVNIITYNPLYDDVDAITVTGGTQGTIRGSAVTTFQDKGLWAVRVSASAGLDHDFAMAFPAFIPPLDQKQNTRGAVDVDGIFQVTPHLQVGLELNHSEVKIYEMDPAYVMDSSRYMTSSVKGQVNADTDFGLVQFLAYTNWIAADAELNSFGQPMDFDDQSMVLQLQDVVRIGANHVVRAAFEFRHNEVNTTPTEGGRIFYNTPSFSGMWNWTISPSLSWTNAVRFDSVALGRSGTAPAGYPFNNSDWDRNLSEWSLNSGLVWKATADDTLRLIVSRGIQLPSLSNFGGFLVNVPWLNSSGNPFTDDSEVMNYELGWDRNIESIDVILRSSLYWQKTTEVISLAGAYFPGPPAYSTTGNVGNSDAVGGEISLSGAFAQGWSWGLSYRLETIKDKFEAFALNGAAYIDFQHTTPKHQLKANLGWTLDQWEADVAAYYQSNTLGLIPTLTGTTLTPVKDYLNADARVGYRINDNLTVSVSGQNLLQSRQIQTSGSPIERRVFVNLGASF